MLVAALIKTMIKFFFGGLFRTVTFKELLWFKQYQIRTIAYFCFKVSDLDSAAQIPVHSGEGNGRQEQGESEEGKDKEADGHSKQKEDSWDWPEERVCHTHERAIPIQETVEALDITEEGWWKHKLQLLYPFN